MAERAPQNFANHTRWDPAVHFFIVPVLLITTIAAIVHFAQRPGIHTAWFVILSIALLIMAFVMRIYSLRVQDRVIRLEERLRLATLLPESLRWRIGELREGQLVALRFASDEELPALVEEALAKKLSGMEIKKAIKNWRPDYWRV